MRVLTVVDALRLGGAETLIAQLARVAVDSEIELHVVSLHGDTPELSKLAPMLREAGVEPVYLGVTRTIDPRGLWRLVRHIREVKPDVVHAHLEMAITMAVIAARIARVPVVSTFHHVHRTLSGAASAREKLAVEVATRGDSVIFVSQASLKSFADRYRAKSSVPANWIVVHNGIDLSFFTLPEGARPQAPADLGIAGLRMVTVLAALRDFKGISSAIDAWPAIAEAHPDARLLLVGSGEEEQSLRSQVGRLKLESSVQFAGMRTDIPAILQASELVVLPSIYGENLPTVLMEAGACGRPVVSSNVGGVADIVADGVTGILVAPGDSAGVAQAVLTLLADPAKADAMGAAGRQRMEKLFDARKWALALRVVYLQALKKAGR